MNHYSSPILSTRNLNLWYNNNHHALKNINTQFQEKTVNALIGPSGCGKSTFLRCFNRLNDELEGTKITGEIYYRNTNIYSHALNPVTLRRKVGMVFQKPNPFPGMSIFDNVIAGVKLNKLAHPRDFESIVVSTLQRVGLWDEVKDKLKENGTQLSGGQQQRLCIARTIAPNPEVILMDEPTSALDPLATEKIELLINELKMDFTVIIVTHNMQQARRISDHVHFFILGEIIEEAPSYQFFTEPKEEKTQAYISGLFG